MTHVLVTGGTGHLGRDLVRTLVQQGNRVRVLARSPGRDPRVEWAIGDLATGQGLQAAFDGVHTVINAATFSPIARRGGIRPVDFFTSPSDVDVEGTGRLLALSRAANVKHFLHVSIAGLDRASLPYARVKLRGETLVRESSLPWTVVRAMPFYYLLERMLAGLAWLPVWPVPRASFNPVDTSDVAEYLAACALEGPRGVRDDIGGPQDLACSEFARQYQRARNLHRPVLPLLSDATARGMGFIVSHGVRGKLRWSEWLQRPGMNAAA